MLKFEKTMSTTDRMYVLLMCTMKNMYSPSMPILKGGMPKTFKDPFMVFVYFDLCVASSKEV